MKKIILLFAAMTVCAGMAFAQSPAKKPAAKPASETAVPAKAEPKSESTATVNKAGCGNCPHHKQCGKNAQTMSKPESTAKGCNKENKESATPQKPKEDKTAPKK